MLISCPECLEQISDKASYCPKCGCPNSEWVNSTPTTLKSLKQPKKKSTHAHMRLPNGFGQIKTLSGNRRRPYAAYPPIKMSDYDENGKPPKQKAIGYFETWYDAYDMLAKYNDGGLFGKTFSVLYEEWYNYKFNNPNKQLSESRVDLYEWAYSYCDSLKDKPIVAIDTEEMQNIVNNAFVNAPSSADMITSLFSQMYDYAINKGYLTLNPAKLIVKPEYETEHGDPLTEEEVTRLWEHANDHKHIRTALILAYTGYRISELEVCEIDLENRLFKGGVKTPSGRDRIVPIHPLIYDFVVQFDQKKYNHNSWRKTGWNKVLELCDLDTETKKCTPHSLRHTFSWLADKYKMEFLSKQLIMGHSLKKQGVTVDTYGHRTIDELRTEMEKIQK